MFRKLFVLLVLSAAGCQSVPAGRTVKPEREAEIDVQVPVGDPKATTVHVRVSTKF